MAGSYKNVSIPKIPLKKAKKKEKLMWLLLLL